MKPTLTLSAIIATIGIFALQADAMAQGGPPRRGPVPPPAPSRPAPAPSRVSPVPSSVLSMDKNAHDLAEAVQREIRSRGRRPSPLEVRLIQASEALENRAHNLRDTVDRKRGGKRASSDISSLSSAFDSVNAAARQLRLGDRTRGAIRRAHDSLHSVTHDRSRIIAAASNVPQPPPRPDYDHHHGPSRGRR